MKVRQESEEIPMSESAATASTSESIQQTLKPLKLYASGALALALLCALVINLWQLPALAKRQVLDLSQQQATNQATALARFIEDQQTFLRFLATQPSTLKALRKHDFTALSKLESRYTAGYDYAKQLSMIPLSPMGTAAIDFPEHRLNSIETAMIIDTNRGKATTAEAYREGDNTLISIMQPVLTGSVIDGVILLRIDDHTIRNLLQQSSGGTGEATLMQVLRNRPAPLISAGGSDQSNVEATANVPGNDKWLIRFRPSLQSIALASPSTWFSWATLISAGLTLLLLGLWLNRHLCNKLVNELEDLRNYLQKLLSGERALPPALGIPALATIGADAFEISQRPAISGKPSTADAAATAKLGQRLANQQAMTPETILESTTTAAPPAETPPREFPPISPGIFRAYDIRGIVGQDLTTDAVYQIGIAIGSEAQDKGEKAVLIARDGRLSSEELSTQLARGLQDSGCDAIDLGAVPTPALYFATQQLNTSSGVMVTGSHNPPSYNGLKILIAGKTLAEGRIQDLKRRIDQKQLLEGQGYYNTANIGAQYIDFVLGDIALAQPLKIVIDCGNGIAGVLAPRLFEELGCEVVPLYCDVDGNFPNHHPDPTVAANLQDLIDCVLLENADLGLAFDGDGDRLGVVSASGDIVEADRLLMLFAQDVVSRNPGCDVIFDVKCTRHLNDIIASYGGRPIMWKSGHSLIKQKMQETGALLGGEYSGHIFFKERWFGFDDGLYSAARLVEIMSTTDPDLDQLLAQFPKPISTPEIQIEVGDERKFDIMKRFAVQADFGDGKITDIDGIRVDFPAGWGLIRASNTTPNLTLRFEAESDDILTDIKHTFKQQLLAIEPDLVTPL
jgi:phosphomannomutase/phosphoglucomutase